MYIVWDTARHRVLNPFAIFLLAGALSGAVVSFLRLDGVYFALKDALHSGLLVLICFVSLALRRPLFEFLFYGVVAPETPRTVGSAAHRPGPPAGPPGAGRSDLAGGPQGAAAGPGPATSSPSSFVTLPFGTPAFNAQVASRPRSWTFPLAIVLDGLFYGLAAWLTLQATRRLTGGRAWPWQQGFWAELEALNSHGDGSERPGRLAA